MNSLANLPSHRNRWHLLAIFSGVCLTLALLTALGHFQPRPAQAEGVSVTHDASWNTVPAQWDIQAAFEVPDWIISGENTGDRYAYAVATAGDVNGDGYADVIVGAPYYNNYGRIYVYHGSSGGLSTTPAFTMTGTSTLRRFGHAVATAGDINNDGYDDVIVGAPEFTLNNGIYSRVYVYYGSSSGLSSAGALQLTGEGDDDFGSIVSTAGDVNGDNYDDVIIGAPHFSGTYRGKVYVFPGGSSGLVTTPIFTDLGRSDWEQFGGAVATAGDVNSDGYDDILIGERYGSQSVYVHHGGAGGLSSTPVITLSQGEYGDAFGGAISTAGDINGDGYADILVSAPTYGSSNVGRLYLFHGSSAGLSSTPALSITGQAVYNHQFGYAVATAGDVNGDGYADVMVGAADGNSWQGKSYLYHGSSAGLNTSPAATAAGANTGDRFAYALSLAGDVNGDGYSDLMVGAYGYYNGDYRGRAYVYHGGGEGMGATAAFSASGATDLDYMGRAVATAGDVNGDGLTDLVVGAPGASSSTGLVHVYYATPSGLAPSPALTLTGEMNGDQLGYALSTAGDVNGDGYADLVVGAPWYGVNSLGRIYVYYGSGSGLSATPAFTDTGEQLNGLLGHSVAGAGDVDGDGYADLIVGATGINGNQGAVYIYYGGPTGLSGPRSWIDSGESAGDRFGGSVAPAGDVNGDGYADIVVGAHAYASNTGRAYLYHGQSGGLTAATPALTLTGSLTGDQFGYAVSTAGDVNGDGYSDVIVGAPYAEGGGAAYVFHGSSSGLSATPDFTTWSAPINYLGFDVSAAGDMNGDGYADVAVGAPGYPNQSGRGAVLVYYGSSTGLSISIYDLNAGENDGDAYGIALATAGDVNGDGFADLMVGAKDYPAFAYRGKAYLYLGNNGDAGYRHLPAQTNGRQYLQPWNLSYAADAISLEMAAISPMGRRPTILQVEACPAGAPFGDGRCSVVTSTMWTVVTAPVTLEQTVPGLAEKTLYHWRARLLYDGLFYTHGPWRRLLGQSLEADLRVAQPPNPAVHKSVSPADLFPGDPLTYTLVFSNSGTFPTVKVTLSDLVPLSVTNRTVISSGVAITDTGAVPGYVWELAPLAPGEGGVITISGLLDPAFFPGYLTNTVTITSPVDADPDDSLSTATAAVWGSVAAVSPTPNTRAAALTTNLTATTSHPLGLTRVSTETFAVHGGYHGRLAGVYSEGSIVFDPAADLIPGEQVEASVTAGIWPDGVRARPFVWQFRAAVPHGSGIYRERRDVGGATTGTYATLWGDMDGDGDLDLVATGDLGLPRVYFNAGDGSFPTEGVIGPGSRYWSMAIGDVDGDGDLDVVLGNFQYQDRVYLNAGDGTFPTWHNIGPSNGSWTYAVALGDIDGDGDLDLAVGNSGQNLIYFNPGDGSFPASAAAGGAGTTYAVAFGDADNDGDLDLFVGNNGSDYVHLNAGDGAFTSSYPIGASAWTYDMALGDLDGDGDLDLVTAIYQGQNRVHLNDGDGSYDTTTYNVGPGNDWSRGIDLGDVDGDGDLDLAVGNVSQRNVIYLNDGDGTFDTRSYDVSDDSERTYSVALGETDGDGDLDLAAGTNNGQDRLYLNQNQIMAVDPAPNSHTAPVTASLTITASGAISLSSATSGGLVIHGGFRGQLDGAVGQPGPNLLFFNPATDFFPGELVNTTVTADLIVDGQPLDAPLVWQFRTAVTGGYGWFVYSEQALSAVNSRRSLLGDLDGDGDLDVFVANYNNTETDSVWLNDGSGIYTRHWTNTGSVRYTFDAALGDLDGDGDLDIYETCSWQSDRILLNNGDGSFTHHQYVGSASDWGLGVALGDLDADGDLDAFVVNSTSQANYVWLNDGTGTMSRGQGTGSISSTGVALGDLDGDGDLDALVINNTDPGEIWLNHGDGTFENSGQALGSAAGQGGVALGDLDGDGDLDAFIANFSQPDTVWMNDGAGNLADSGQTLGLAGGRNVQLGDVDGDGDLDALVANNDPPNRAWLNNGSGTFSASGQGFSDETEGSGVSLGDVDGDGDLDILFAYSGIRSDQVWLNQNTADLALSKSVTPLVVAPGGPVTYTLVYTNHGPETASGVIITDLVPVTLTNLHYDFTRPVTRTGGLSYTWELGRLAVGEGGLITVMGTVDPGASGLFSLTNTATITSPLVVDDADNNSSTVTHTVDAVAPDPPALVSPADGAVLSDTTPTLTWQPSAALDVSGYLLDLDGSVMDLGDVTEHTTAVLPDGVYSWTVAAYDAVGNAGPYTDTWSFEVDTTPPQPPQLLSPADGAVLTDTTPTLVWTASAGAAGYLLDLDGTVLDLGDVTAYTTTALVDGVYTWTVAAYD
ncbi:MAG: VCBS repeat-containing protein, partial [Anaerolineae bacterium]|nr:VCBS repeat-containing protein [Anaerolineae bacterium]